MEPTRFQLVLFGTVLERAFNKRFLGEFIMSENFTDSRDGKVYKTVKIGNQIWMAENLNYEAEGSKCYDNDSANGQKYGRLYNWESAKKACPEGWHLPSDEEWGTLMKYVNSSYSLGADVCEGAGTKLKATSGWQYYDGDRNGKDKYGFSALPGGYGYNNVFKFVGTHGYWWSATEVDADRAYTRIMYYTPPDVDKFKNSKGDFCSVRCVRADLTGSSSGENSNTATSGSNNIFGEFSEDTFTEKFTEKKSMLPRIIIMIIGATIGGIILPISGSHTDIAAGVYIGIGLGGILRSLKVLFGFLTKCIDNIGSIVVGIFGRECGQLFFALAWLGGGMWAFVLACTISPFVAIFQCYTEGSVSNKRLLTIFIALGAIAIALVSLFPSTQTNNSKSDNNPTPEPEVEIYKPFTDPRDGTTYKTVTIDEQTWMAENLNFYMEGSKCYNNDPENCEKYGRLYNWAAAKKACPNGWHLPSNAEWDILYRTADGTSGEQSPYKSETAGKYLKATSGWNSSGNGEDYYGFAALPGGSFVGKFQLLGDNGYWLLLRTIKAVLITALCSTKATLLAGTTTANRYCSVFVACKTSTYIQQSC
ncbi:MAG: fibrobacter succinogenes major paralogous domain-containing protein [Fibromonadaceae bacterium]|jgi:uncharacterized protein (TIGR02145 family)|nr:fibrobacter succinogenes major paralogous domain-containing protein [Fibromonadaceae bacterium]